MPRSPTCSREDPPTEYKPRLHFGGPHVRTQCCAARIMEPPSVPASLKAKIKAERAERAEITRPKTPVRQLAATAAENSAPSRTASQLPPLKSGRPTMNPRESTSPSVMAARKSKARPAEAAPPPAELEQRTAGGTAGEQDGLLRPEPEPETIRLEQRPPPLRSVTPPRTRDGVNNGVLSGTAGKQAAPGQTRGSTFDGVKSMLMQSSMTSSFDTAREEAVGRAGHGAARHVDALEAERRRRKIMTDSRRTQWLEKRTDRLKNRCVENVEKRLPRLNPSGLPTCQPAPSGDQLDVASSTLS